MAKRYYDLVKPDNRRYTKVEPIFVNEADRENERIAAQALLEHKKFYSFVQTEGETDDVDVFFRDESEKVIAAGEVKRRNNLMGKYPDTAIIYSKIKKLQKFSFDAYLIVYFDDVITYCDIKKLDESECKFGMMVRRDCGQIEQDYMIYIPNKYLHVIQSSPKGKGPEE